MCYVCPFFCSYYFETLHNIKKNSFPKSSTTFLCSSVFRQICFRFYPSLAFLYLFKRRSYSEKSFSNFSEISVVNGSALITSICTLRNLHFLYNLEIPTGISVLNYNGHMLHDHQLTICVCVCAHVSAVYITIFS